MSLKTDCGQDFRDRFGRLLAFVAAKDDLPAFAEGNGYDFRQLQLQAGTSTA